MVAESVSQSAAGSSGVASGTTMQSPEISAKGVTPKFKGFLDEYEAIIDQYIVMAQKAGAPGQSDPAILMDYFNLLYRLADFEKKTAEYNQEEMTDADAKYYRNIMQMLLLMRLITSALGSGKKIRVERDFISDSLNIYKVLASALGKCYSILKADFLFSGVSRVYFRSYFRKSMLSTTIDDP